MAIAFAFLLVHAKEPLRLGAGDPTADASVLISIRHIGSFGFFGRDLVDIDPLVADSYRPIHDPPLSELLYGATSRVFGITDIAVFRYLALAFSALAVWLLFAYARRIWDDKIALVITVLFSTSLAWITFADSIHHVPVTEASGFLALWGLVRVIETRQRRHYAAAFFGAFACFLASYDYWLFLPLAALFTIYSKRGNPLGSANRWTLWICGTGWLVAIATKVLLVLAAGAGTESVEATLAPGFPTLLRRCAFLFTPLFWVVVATTAWRTIRTPSLRSVLDEGLGAVFPVAVAFVVVFPRMCVQSLLPFYAIGSAILVQRLLDGGRARRAIAIVWIVAAPLWALYFTFARPASQPGRDDVAAVNAYLDANDRNDFVMSNLLVESPIQAGFARHNWKAPATIDTSDAHLTFLELFAATGTDYVHVLVFTSPESRFNDSALGQIASRRLSSVTGWPALRSGKARDLVRAFDKNVLANLQAVHAKPVLHTGDIDVYRIDRATVREAMSGSIPVVRTIQFNNVSSNAFKLIGWGLQWLTEPEGIGVSSVDGYVSCANPDQIRAPGEPRANPCKTVVSRSSGLEVLDGKTTNNAELMIRVERSCDLRLTVRLASPGLLGLSVNDYRTNQCSAATEAVFVVPQKSVRPGINVVALEKRTSRFAAKELRADVSSLVIEPLCTEPVP